MEHKWVCIQCGEKEIPQYAEYCDECAEKQMSRIGGWLWLPLITLFLSLAGGAYTLSRWYDLYQWHAGFIPDRVLLVMSVNIVLTILTMLLILTTLYYFFRRSRYLPTLYIAFILFAIASEAIQEMVRVNLMDVRVDFDLYYPLIRLVIYAIIWISYFLVSERVKRTFIH
ncbi:DUF2569 domain-containing protein [Morganella morganii]|uniref:DUF2569 domain-containing protein n=1 Tax=Morganella morganii TaxID=582 RepID=UPI001A23C2F6|nr:DUF2569 domain-containing protein [Morganella morganii]MCU6212781.1 DUF2569 domain-containing protein [Morganella morganii]MCU6226391.1 DUF2569 domain-containing protein [Morganella morganii]MCU6235256.1 DUF2569 domain-containing protein [Morganella morganii]MCU6237938.1 DUF2569 domain-containing protein [Morganella morganii]MCU6272327.1 DUF2569 domain-containing protein [Morganella morganii]